MQHPLKVNSTHKKNNGLELLQAIVLQLLRNVNLHSIRLCGSSSAGCHFPPETSPRITIQNCFSISF